MATIPLRQYNREIETLIDRGQTEEAIAHCLHVLQVYPKHLETYRLLGKSFLESQRYTDAADIFQRVLAVVPDDFIAHIGMSIIREDEGNLDASIWHMERAFEVQPANAAVQDELRRLYGRRDGIEPPRVRLTRGALVHMYARGDLYQQAISEIKAALAEDPHRPDLSVLLARMYHRAGQRVEAAEMCSQLLNKYPFCYEANRILAEILPGTGRAEDAEIYQQRVCALDPYAAFISTSSPSPTDVPDNAINIEHLDYEPGLASTAAQPQWAASLGIDLGEPGSDQPVPDWLQSIGGAAPPSGQAASAPPFTLGEAPTVPGEAPGAGEGAKLPDWMQAAGWTVPAEPIDESQIPPITESGEGELAPADIPDWLRAMAPPEGSAAEAAPTEMQPEGSQQPPAGGAPLDFAAIFGGEPPADQALPQWLEPESTGSEELPIAGKGEESDELPDWVREMQATSGAPTEAASAGLEAESLLPSEELPDWLKELTPEAPADEAPAELVAAAPASSSEELPDWLKELTPEAPIEEAPAAPIAAPPAEEIPAAAPSEELPDWLKEQTPEAPIEEAPAAPIAAPLAEEIPAAAPSEELPDWLKELTPEAPVEEAPAAPVAAPPTEEIPAAAPTEGLPDWLQELQPEATEPTAGAPQAGIPPAEAPETATPPTQAEQDAGLAWLESLAAKHGAEEETLYVPPEERLETPPEWVQGAPETGVEPVPPAAEAAAEETPAAPSADLPDWMKELAPEPPVDEAPAAPIAEEIPAAPSADLPDWLKELAPEAPVEEAPAEPLEASLAEQIPSAAPSEELPDWIQKLQPEASEPAAGAPQAEPPLAEAPEAAAPPSQAEQDAGLAWLESLAAKHGAEEETLYVPPEERLETPPEWVQGAAVGDTTPAAPDEDTQEMRISRPTPELAEEDTQEIRVPRASLDQAGEGEPALEAPPTPPAEVETPDWLQAQAQERAPEAETPPPTGLELPDWLQAPAAEAPPVPGALPADEGQIAQPTEEIPDWLKELQPPAAAEVQPEPLPEASPPEASAEPVEPSPEAVPGEIEASLVEEGPSATAGLDQDAAFAWLEGLAAQQGAQEEDLFVQPEERTTRPPDWIQNILAEEETAVPPAAEPEAAPPEAEVAAEAISPLPQAETELEIQPVAEESLPSAVEAAPTPEDAAPSEADLPQWLEGIAPRPPIETPPVPPSSPELPDWLKSIEEEAPAPEAEAEATGEGQPQAEGELPEWLQGLGPSTGALESAPPAEGMPAEAPWLKAEEEPGDADLFQPPLVDRSAPEGAGWVAESPAPVTPEDFTVVLSRAQASLSQGELKAALQDYAQLIRANQFLDNVIFDLRQSLFEQTEDQELWQTLGDAYMRADRLQDALDAYTRAEELLH